MMASRIITQTGVTNALSRTTSRLSASQPLIAAQARSNNTVLPLSGHLQTRMFSGSGSVQAGPPTRKVAVPVKNMNRNPHMKTGPAPPSAGERRQFKKKVILSNPNALPVSLPCLERGSLSKGTFIGQVITIPDEMINTLSSMKAFKPSQGWGFFRRPSFLVRPETIQLVGDLQRGAEKRQTVRKVLVGPRGSGKSLLLAQALAHASMNNWIVLYIPEGRDIVLNRNEYSPIEGTDPTIYQQPELIQNLLKQLRQYRDVLENIQVDGSTQFPVGLERGLSLLGVCERGLKTSDLAWPAFRIILKELMRPNTGSELVPRPPILMALDGLSHFMDKTEYLSPELKNIHAHDMALVQHFVSCLSGQENKFAGVQEGGFANGGAVIAAMSASGTSVSDSLRFALDRATKAQSKDMIVEIPTWNGYKAPDTRVIESIDPVKVDIFPVGPLDFSGTHALVNYYTASGLLRPPQDVSMFIKEQLAATGGIPSELERALLRTVKV